MRRIYADFNDLDAWERDEITLAPVDEPSYLDEYNLREGERVIAEDGTLHAEAVVKIIEADDGRWWVAVIDRPTMHDDWRDQQQPATEDSRLARSE